MRPEGDFYRGLAWALLFSAVLWILLAELVQNLA
jgi:hypothetical protein